jgi:hypothetical protein
MKFAKKNLLLLTITGWFLRGCATGTVFSAAAATGVHILTPQGGTNHCPCAPDAALDFDCLDRAIQGTRPALHAGFRVGKYCSVLPLIKNPVGADLCTSFAVNAPVGIIPECGIGIRVKHQITPKSLLTPRMRPVTIPKPAMAVITGTYRKISFFTPVRDV